MHGLRRAIPKRQFKIQVRLIGKIGVAIFNPLISVFADRLDRFSSVRTISRLGRGPRGRSRRRLRPEAAHIQISSVTGSIHMRCDRTFSDPHHTAPLRTQTPCWPSSHGGLAITIHSMKSRVAFHTSCRVPLSTDLLCRRAKRQGEGGIHRDIQKRDPFVHHIRDTILALWGAQRRQR